jgi:hypothetical protein
MLCKLLLFNSSIFSIFFFAIPILSSIFLKAESSFWTISFWVGRGGRGMEKSFISFLLNQACAALFQTFNKGC